MPTPVSVRKLIFIVKVENRRVIRHAVQDWIIPSSIKKTVAEMLEVSESTTKTFVVFYLTVWLRIRLDFNLPEC